MTWITMFHLGEDRWKGVILPYYLMEFGLSLMFMSPAIFVTTDLRTATTRYLMAANRFRLEARPQPWRARLLLDILPSTRTS